MELPGSISGAQMVANAIGDRTVDLDGIALYRTVKSTVQSPLAFGFATI